MGKSWVTYSLDCFISTRTAPGFNPLMVTPLCRLFQTSIVTFSTLLELNDIKSEKKYFFATLCAEICNVAYTQL